MRKRGTMFSHGLTRGACLPLVWLAFSALASAAQAATPASAKALTDVIKKNCVECHNTEDWAGSLALDTMDLAHASKEPEVWEETINKLRGRLMPPAGKKQPSQAEVNALVGFLETSIDTATRKNRVGHVPLQRLSRVEYAASIKELIGVDVDPKQALPTEVEVEGFSNIASVLSVSPTFMEQYMVATRRAVKLALGESVPKMAKVTVPITAAPANAYPLGTRGNGGGGGGFGGGRGAAHFTYTFPADGEYRFNIPAEDYIDIGLYPRGAENAATMVYLVDGVEVARKEIGGGEWLNIADRDGPAGKKVLLQMASTAAKITAGKHEVTLTYINRSNALGNAAQDTGRPSMPGLATAIEIEGPFQPTGRSMNESRAKVFACMPKSAAEERPCAERIARELATKAFRRPATDTDLAPLMKFYDAGRKEAGGFEAGITELTIAVLSSPDFLYRAIPTVARTDGSRPLNDVELATRLAFFLWGTGPDKELIDLAAAKKLSGSGAVEAQVARMLKDPRASTLVDKFALAWLNLDELEAVEIEGFSPAMRSNFETEIRMFLASVLLEDRSVIDIINGNWTFLNESLAQHYGITGVKGPTFRRVQLANENRFGILGKGATLLRTSYGDRTSPVLRGAWVLERLMGTPPAPPPPNVNTDIAVKDGEKVTTVRARLEVHRQAPNCQGCHGIIDPPGLALENFDNQGRWRDVDVAASRAPIDASTVLSSGVKLNGPAELRKHLSSNPEQFALTLTERLMMYALNREIEYFDMPQVRQIVRNAAKQNYSFSAILNGVVGSDAFRRQGADEHKKTQTVAMRP
jgi:mono/diheme cytochrome c family protein